MKRFRALRKHVLLYVLAFAVVLAFSLDPAVVSANGDGKWLFTMETAEEIANFDDDNTGAKLSLADKVAKEGKGAMAITPSGSAPETKLGVEVSGDVLCGWAEHEVLSIYVYIPKNMKIVPNSFFLGMADVAKGWEWVDGVFAETTLESGWNSITYILSDGMRNIKENGKYKLYFSFFKADENEEKLPLAETFMWME